MLEHKGYTGRVVFDDDADLFHGEVAGIRDMVTFHGRSTDELRQAFRDSVDDYLEFCESRSEPPNAPPRVHVVLPLPDTLAARIHTQAAAAHMTDEAWITRVVEEHLTTAQS
ncbi:MAG: type II toxin-antitoxin system HicB family antitoxin [Planctomycetaceae bacterium]